MAMKSDKRSIKDTVRLYMRGIRLLSQYIPHLFTAITLHCLVMATTPYITVWLAACIIGELDGARDVQTIWMWVGVAVSAEVLLALLGGVLRRYKEAKWECLYRSVDRVLTDKLLSMDHADIDDQKTRDLLARVRETMSALGCGLVLIPNIYQNMLLGIVGVISAVAVTWSLFILPVPQTAQAHMLLNSPLMAVVIAAAFVATALIASKLSKTSQRVLDTKTGDVVALDRLYYAFYDTMFDPSKAADMRLYRQDELIVRYLQDADRVFFEKNGLKRRLTRSKGGVLRALSAGVSALWMGVMYAFVAVKALSGAFGLGLAAQYIGALTMLSGNLEKLSWSIAWLRRNAPYLKTVYEFLDIPHRMYQGSLTTEKRADRDYEVEFRHVSFRYPGQERKAVSDVSVILKTGSRLAIVGENGSGKSTFVKLLCRLYDPDEGEILLNGIDIRKYKYSEYIGVISVVFQDFGLLSQPLGDNVAGTASYDRARVMRCLEEAGFGESLRQWERGLDTPLYRHFFENGVSLSLGDAQRIAIARALHKNAPFIILDEPTAALDPITEAEIYARFDRIVDDRAAIYVSHRLSSCRFCDEILVFDRGRIVQRGTHDELVLQTDGNYHRLWNAQAQYYKR